MISSIVMIGKASAESYLTFGSKNELEGVSVYQHLCLLATTAPAFILTAVFRVGSFTVITACNWALGLLTLSLGIPLFPISLALIKYCGCCCGCCRTRESEEPGKHYLGDLSLGDIFKSFIAELSTTSNWGRRGREKSRRLQLIVATFFLLTYTILLLWIIIDPNSDLLQPQPPVYHPDPAALRACGIAVLSSGVVAFPLQILLPKILLRFQS